MTNLKKPLAITFIILGVLILLLLAIRGWQAFQRAQARQQLQQQARLLELDRQSADRLLQRLEAVKQLREELAVPQVQLNIKL